MFSKLSLKTEHPLFTYGVLFFIGLGWLSIILTIFNIFYTWILACFLILSIAFLTWLIVKKKIKIKFNKEQITVFLIILIAASIFSYFSSPTIFSGRDQGSFSEAAIRLSQNHKLEFSTPASKEFFQIYGTGKALNFPGFDYLKNGNLITHFPIGYIAWLATFFSIFGYFGLQLANFISLVIFAFSIYLLIEKFAKRNKTKYFALGIVLNSFVFYWFSKFTLSENLAWMLVWFGIYKFWNFWEKACPRTRDTAMENKLELILAFLAFGLFLFVRIEAIAFLVMMIILLFGKYRKKLKEVFDRNLNCLLLAILFIYIGVVVVNQNFYFSVLKSFLKPFLKGASSENAINWFDLQLYLGNTFSLYSMFVVIIAGVLGIIYFIKKKKYQVLIPLFIVLPSFYYLIVPNISLDHPWMLRRFAFSIYPALCFLAIIFIDHFFKNKIYRYFIFCAILLANVTLAFIYLPFVPHKGLSSYESIFSQEDLILVDRMTTGDPYSMLSGPLSFQNGLNSVYFFNPQDLQKINLDKFEKVYLVIPDDSIPFYYESVIGNRLKKISNFKIKNTLLEKEEKSKERIVKEDVEIPFKNHNVLTYGGIYEYQK